jgi:hypothetical protein
MAHGDAGKAKVTDVFRKRLEELREKAATQARQFRYFYSYREWSTPKDLKDANLYDTPGMHSPTWNRNEINQIYSNSVQAGPGKEGGCNSGLIAMKLQCDFLAAEERAWRLRHVNLVRAQAAAHGRLKGQGTPEVSVFDVLLTAVENWIQSGTATDGPPSGVDGTGAGFAGQV